MTADAIASILIFIAAACLATSYVFINRNAKIDAARLARSIERSGPVAQVSLARLQALLDPTIDPATRTSLFHDFFFQSEFAAALKGARLVMASNDAEFLQRLVALGALRIWDGPRRVEHFPFEILLISDPTARMAAMVAYAQESLR